MWGNMAITRNICTKISETPVTPKNLQNEDLDLSVLIHKVGGTIYYDRYLKVHIHGVRF